MHKQNATLDLNIALQPLPGHGSVQLLKWNGVNAEGEGIADVVERNFYC